MSYEPNCKCTHAASQHKRIDLEGGGACMMPDCICKCYTSVKMVPEKIPPPPAPTVNIPTSEALDINSYRDERYTAYVKKIKDMINHPAHYQGKVESIEAIEASGHGPGFCIGNAQKYLFRAGKKSDDENKTPQEQMIEDLNKVQWYVARALQQFQTGEYELVELPDGRMAIVQALKEKEKR